jgi:hypothetical protein
MALVHSSGSFGPNRNVGSGAARGKALNEHFKMITLFIAHYLEPKIRAHFLEPEIRIWSARGAAVVGESIQILTHLSLPSFDTLALSLAQDHQLALRIEYGVETKKSRKTGSQLLELS